MKSLGCSIYSVITLSLVVTSLLTTTPSIDAAEELKFFESAGVPIAYVDVGQGEPVILIHGFAINHHFQWIAPKMLQSLTPDFRVIAIDNRGHGKSGKPHDPNQYGLVMVEDVLRLMDHLKIEKAHIVGYSMGGAITLKFVTSHPERVISAVVGGMGWLRATPEWLSFREKLAEGLESEEGVGPLLQRLTPTDQAARSPRDVRIANMVVSMANDRKALAAVSRGMLSLEVSEADLKRNKVPVLSIVGSVDPIGSINELRSTMPDVTAVDIPGEGHMGAVFDPKFREEIAKFLRAHKTSVTKSK